VPDVRYNGRLENTLAKNQATVYKALLYFFLIMDHMTIHSTIVIAGLCQLEKYTVLASTSTTKCLKTSLQLVSIFLFGNEPEIILGNCYCCF